jgi:tetratricopeptide (TPR) repeat protein
MPVEEIEELRRDVKSKASIRGMVHRRVAGVTRFLYAAALALVGGAATADPPPEFFSRIQQLIVAGDLKAARQYLARAASEFPASASVFNVLGIAQAQSGDYRAAEASFQKSIRLAPRAPGAYENLGQLYQRNAAGDAGAVVKAIGVYEQLLGFEPANVEARYQAAVLHQLRGAYALSLKHLSALPDQAQGRAAALAIRCADLAGLGRLEEAKSTAMRLLDTADLAEADVAGILPALYQHGAEELATRLLNGIANRGLAGAGSLRQLSAEYQKQEKLPLARSTLEHAAQLEPKSVPILMDLARIAYRQQDREGALGYLARARDLEPRNAAVHFTFGVITLELELPVEARKSLLEAVRLDPSNPDYRYALAAMMLLRGRDPSLAIPHLQAYRTARPDEPRGRFALGIAYFLSGQADEAEREFKAVLDAPETRSGAHFFLGRLDMRGGDDRLDQAIAHFEQSVRFNPGYSDAYAELGLAQMRQNQFERAEMNLQRARELDPEGFLPNLNLLKLYQRTRDKRADAQAQFFEELKKKRGEHEALLYRTLEVRPY